MIEAQKISSLPRIGDFAPNFTTPTTHGEISFYDWKKDAWALLFSHPADFTPVCSTELIELAKENNFFSERNIKLMGLSIDSIHSHLAWIENLKSIFGIELPFPMIADLRAHVAESYGMIHPNESNTVTVRAFFTIDPSNKIRSIIYYPLNIGRSVHEIKRMVQALQTADKNQVACPVNWQTGDKVIIPPPKTIAEVKERNNSSYEKLDFYLCKKSL